MKCNLCDKEFTKGILLNNHIKKEHNMSKYDYLLQTEYNGIHPKCACGCGKEVRYNDKKRFATFYSDHLRYVYKDRIKKIPEYTYHDIDNKLKRYNITRDQLKKYYDDYILILIPMSNIVKETTIDKRTILKWWRELDFILDENDFKRITKIQQFHWNNKNVPTIDTLILTNIYNFIKKHPNTFSLPNLRTKFNLKESRHVLYKGLCDNYDKNEIDKFLKFGVVSKPEMNFFFILSYYFGQKNISKQFKLNRKVYDFKLGNKILIEYDGEYWHSTDKAKENDKIKDEIAIKEGYTLFRIKEKEEKDIEILKKIEKLWKQDQKLNLLK